MYYLIYYIILCFVIISNVMFFSMNMRGKYNILIIFSVYYICNMFAQIMFEEVYRNYFCKTIFCLCYNVLILVFMYEDIFWKKMVYWTEEVLILFFAEIIATTISHLCFNISSNELMPMGRYKVIGASIAMVFEMTFYLLASIFQKNVSYRLSEKKIQKFMIIIMAQIVIPLSTYLYTGGSLYVLSSLFSMIGIAADILIIRTMVIMEKKEATEESISYLEKQNEIVMNYCNKLNSNVNNLESLRNGYKEELEKVYAVSGVKNNDKDILKENVLKPVSCNNTIVSQIVSNAKMQLEKSNCTYDINMKLPEKTGIKPMDLSVILMNMFDNAIEAIKRVSKDNEKLIDGKYQLKASAYIKQNYIILNIRNIKSIEQKINISDKQYISSKENKAAHGYGMQMIDKIVKEKGGSMRVNYGDTWFENEVRIPVN